MCSSMKAIGLYSTFVALTGCRRAGANTTTFCLVSLPTRPMMGPVSVWKMPMGSFSRPSHGDFEVCFPFALGCFFFVFTEFIEGLLVQFE